MAITHDNRPVAVVGYGPSAAAPALRVLLGVAIEELNPYDLAMGRAGEGSYRAVVVENFRPRRCDRGLSECAAARWAVPGRPLTVVSLDDPAGRRLARRLGDRAFAYSDGRTQADLTAKNVNLRWGRLEFEALTDSPAPIPTGSPVRVTGLAGRGALLVEPIPSESEETE